jgi:hypothetical protein
MRKITFGVGITLVVSLVGCNHVPWRRTGDGDASGPAVTRSRATPESLVKYLNDNANLIDSVRSPEVQLDVKADGSGGGLTASLSCLKPRYFRLRASSPAGLEADFGSNMDEFWYFIKRDTPPAVYYCSHDALSNGKVALPFPFQPDMVLTALGMAKYDPAGKYEITEGRGTIDLIEQTVSAQGQPVQHVTRFSATNQSESRDRPQVLAHVLRDKNGKEIFTATILTVQRTREGAEIPTRFKIAWPGQNLELTMKLYDVKVNGLDRNNTGELFTWRDSLKGHPTRDLAQLGTATPTGIQRTSGEIPSKIR